MSIKISFNGATILRPGGYVRPSVSLVGGNVLADTGIVGIVGEANKGAPGDVVGEGLQEYTCEQVSSIIEKYVSGPIVDAVRALVQPARDFRIQNGAQKIYIWKTNSSTTSSKTVQNQDDAPTNILSFTSANYGATENLINMYINQGSNTVDTNAVLLSGAIVFPKNATNAETLILSVNSVNYTCTLTVVGGPLALTQSQWVTVLNGTVYDNGAGGTVTPVWAAIRPCDFLAVSTDQISATLRPTAVPFNKYENMWEYAVLAAETSLIKTLLSFTIASTVNTTTLVVTAGSAGPVRGSRGGRIIVFNRGDTTETHSENDNEESFKIRYVGAGSACVMTISGASDSVKTLATTVTAGPGGEELTITLSAYTTIQDLVTYINNFGGGTVYKCVTSYSKRNSRASTALDRYDAINIKSLPVSVKCALYEIDEDINESSELVVLTRGNVYGQVETISSSAREYFSGAVKGASVNLDFSAGLDAMLAKRINIVVPLISQDATTDITDGRTDASSTYTIASVNSLVDSHCRLASNTKNKNERQAYISIKASFDNSKIAAKAIASEFCSMAFQNASLLDSSGTLQIMQPWAMACLCAGMQAGSEIGEPTTYKYTNAYGISHSDFDPVNDMEEAIDAGLLAVEEPAKGGYRIVCQNTTYGKDSNFCLNRAHVLEVAHYVAYDLRKQLEDIYVGTGRQRGSTTVKAVYTTAISILDKYREAGILIPDSTNGNLGYKDLTITVSGGIVSLSVTITPVVGVDFILIDLTLDQIRDTTA